MDKPVQDRRIHKTRKIIKDTLTEMMHEKPVDQITVKELAERADLNRGTFYFHYRDIYDLLEKSEAEVIEDITQILKKINPKEVAKYASINQPYPALIELFEWFKDNINFGKALMGRYGDISFLDKISTALKSDLFIPNGNSLFNDYLTSYMAHGFLGMIIQWFDENASTSPEEMATIFLRIVANEMKNVE